MADDVDSRAFESMTRITDPFNPEGGVTSWDIGTDPAKLNKRFEDKWIEENVEWMDYKSDEDFDKDTQAPFGTIPWLKDNSNGIELNDSLAIVQYLINKYPGNDWKLKISKNGNYNFWKVQSTLQSCQDNYRPPNKNYMPQWERDDIMDQAKWDVPAYKQAEMDAWEYDGPAEKFEDWREGNGY